MNSNQISKAVRYALVAGAASALAAPSAFAADATTTTDQTANANQSNTAQLGKIEVTGSRIKRTDVETAQPVTIITAKQLKATGLTSVGDILATLPQIRSILSAQVNNGNNGQSTIDLRNLGSDRVLVLVNGRRWVSSIAGTVDFTTIPAAAIDHIEILQDGASAIYGSDVISGVVNIITVKNYNGAEANAFVGEFDGKNDGGGWDGKIQSYDFTIGTNGDKSGIVLNVQYVNQSPMWAGNRTISKEPVIGGGPSSGSSGAAGGRYIVYGFGDQTKGTLKNSACTFYGSVTATVCDLTDISPGNSSTTNTIANLRGFTAADRFNYA